LLDRHKALWSELNNLSKQKVKIIEEISCIDKLLENQRND
jgi:hypothetical protein